MVNKLLVIGKLENQGNHDRLWSKSTPQVYPIGTHLGADSLIDLKGPDEGQQTGLKPI